MVKTVYTGQEVPHVFAANPMADARNSNSTLRAEYGVLWSYQQPIAAYVADRLLITSDSFSVTTSKHTAWARYALNHLSPLSVPRLKTLVRNHSELVMAEYIADRIKEMESIRDSMTRMRAEWKKADAQSRIRNLESVCEFVWNVKLGKKSDWRNAVKTVEKVNKAQAIRRYTQSRNRLESGMSEAREMIDRARADMAADAANGRNAALQNWWRMDRAISGISLIDEMSASYGLGLGASGSFTHAAKLMGKAWAKECTRLACEIAEFANSFSGELAQMRAEYEAARDAQDTERLAELALSDADRLVAWLAGGAVAPRGPVVCRVVGDTVETSKGARVPLADALRIVEMAKACRERGQGISLAGVQVGQYRGTSIDAAGNLTVGCHHITWSAIADCVARFEGESV